MSFVLGLFIGIGSTFIFLIVLAAIFEIPEKKAQNKVLLRIADTLNSIDNSIQTSGSIA